MDSTVNSDWNKVIVIGEDGKPNREDTIKSLDAYIDILTNGPELMEQAIDDVFKANKSTLAIPKHLLISQAFAKTGHPLGDFAFFEEFARLSLKDTTIVRLGKAGGGVKNPYYIETAPDVK